MAMLITGILLVSSVFVLFNVEYPSQPATLILNPPKNVTPPPELIFGNQRYNSPGIGEKGTSFSPTGNATVLMEGYITGINASGKPEALSDQNLYVAVMEAAVMVHTASNGFYQIEVLKSGSGVFAFKAFQYKTQYKKVFIPSAGQTWVNVTLPHSTVYQVSGTTDSTNGSVPGVLIKFSEFLGAYDIISSQNSQFSLGMVNGTYSISAMKKGFSNVTVPENITVAGKPVSGMTVYLHPITTAIFHINGTVENQLGKSIPGATVYSSTLGISVHANGSGFYSIPAVYGGNEISFSSYQYVNTTKYVTATDNSTYSPEIESKDPFMGASGITFNVPFGPSSLSDNASAVNYSVFGSPAQAMTGTMISTQTGQKLSGEAFQAYTSVNGTYSVFSFKTGPLGNYIINFSYTGRYVLVITSTQFPSFNLSSSNPQGSEIGLNTSKSVYRINGTALNEGNGSGLSGVTVGIGNVPGGPSILNLTGNSSGYYNGSIIGGSYYLNFSRPGFYNDTVKINVTGNTTVPAVHLIPKPIGSNFTFWNYTDGSGIPGTNGSGISSALNGTAGSGNASTYSTVPATIKIHLQNGTSSSPLSYLPVEIFARTNGVDFVTKGITDAGGNISLSLAFSGTYVILPSSIQFYSSPILVKTSQATVSFEMFNYTLHKIYLNLTNPLSYAGDSVPVNGMAVGNYALPILPNKPYNYNITGPNFTIFSYYLPAGIYNITYSDKAYVTEYWNISLKTGFSNNTKLKPYLLILSYSSPISWSYSVSGGSVSPVDQAVAGGSGKNIVPLSYGDFSFSAYIVGTRANSTTFSLTASAYEHSLNFSVTRGSLVSSTNFSYNSKEQIYTALYNLTFQQKGLFVYSINVKANLTSYTNVSFNGINYQISVSGHNITLKNYFATGNTLQSTLNLTVSDYTIYDLESVISNSTEIQVYYYMPELMG